MMRQSPNTFHFRSPSHANQYLTAPRDPTLKALEIKAVDLSCTWKRFRQSLPNNEQDEIEGTVPNVENLIKMVEETTKAIETHKAKSKRGKFMKYFTKFCGTLDAHSAMLEALPND